MVCAATWSPGRYLCDNGSQMKLDGTDRSQGEKSYDEFADWLTCPNELQQSPGHQVDRQRQPDQRGNTGGQGQQRDHCTHPPLPSFGGDCRCSGLPELPYVYVARIGEQCQAGKAIPTKGDHPARSWKKHLLTQHIGRLAHCSSQKEENAADQKARRQLPEWI